MNYSKKTLLFLLASVLLVMSCKTPKESAEDNTMLVRSAQTLDSLYAHYSVPSTCLLRENYPSDVDGYTATYLASHELQIIFHTFTLTYGPILVLFLQ